ncbi:MAG: gluconate 2-dehydrogenase subunit 3 family protein [Opitutales bacterium]|nr:gluconate 2-dehydrogenase subunit 3 family protein [Opitutales bacterium]
MATRREFIKVSAAAGAGVAIGGCAKAAKQTAFEGSERECLVALAEQIVPADERCGGATEAGVINFIDNFVFRRYPEILPVYRGGLERLQAASQKLYGKPFERLDFKTQTEFMQKMQKGGLPADVWGKSGQRRFFDEILTRSMQGFYGPPRHGGNKDYMSYRMCKLEMPHVLGQNRYGGER